MQRKNHLQIFENRKQAIALYLSIFIIGTIWDNFAVWRGHWFYPGKGILGIFIGLIPLEDYIFAVVTSYTLLVFYKAIQRKYK